MLNHLEEPKVCRSWAESYRLTHLLYMDDIKLYASSREGLDKILRVLEVFSRDIHMQFGVDKSRIAIAGLAAVSASGERFLRSGDIIVGMEEEETYKYLGFLQSWKMEHKLIKERLKNSSKLG